MTGSPGMMQSDGHADATGRGRSRDSNLRLENVSLGRIQGRLSRPFIAEVPLQVAAPQSGAAVLPGSKPFGRIFDILVATAGLAVSAPVILLAIVAVKLTSPGPAFFRQVRVGLDRRTFTLLKLRTMRLGNDDSSHRELCLRELVDPDAEAGTSDGIFKLEDDPRVTPVGRLLRRFSIDELPQLLNVLVGDMAIVGPRPMLPWEFDVVADTYGARVLVKPGITGLWQVSGRNRVNMRRMLDLDVQYVQQRSWLLDLSIMKRTVRVLLKGDGAR